MELKKLVEAIDAQVLAGDIIGAFDQFAADNCVTLSNPSDKTINKAQKLEALRWFFNNVATINRIERPAVKIGDAITESQFVFDFSNRQGEPLQYSEVIRRTWKNGKLIEEQYLLGETIDFSEPAAAATPAAKAAKAPKATAKKAEVKADIPVAEKKTAAKPVTEKKPAVKSAKTSAPAQQDDLALIEGIGPKIAELLIKGGITTFAELAATKPTAIKAILDAAGKRYQMHDPATWPKQAALARDGKTAELQKLQDKLKGGK